MRVVAVVLAAGASTRFGSPKALAELDGRPVLDHVLDAARRARIEERVVVLGHAADEIENAIEWQGELLVRNPDPELLSTSLQVGLGAASELEPSADAAVVMLGDQPRVSDDVIRGLVAAAGTSDRPIVMPEYADGGGSNPVVIRREAFDLADDATGDRGLGPLLADHRDLVTQVPFAGSNPDVDTPADLDELRTLSGD